MARERKEFKRPSFVRSVQKLFVIASEGTQTEPAYFEAIRSDGNIVNKLIYIEPLKRIKTNGSPSVVLKQLDSFKKEYKLRQGDELWMLVDRDKQTWTPREIATVARECKQKDYGFALSNPCIELWLLLHRRDVSRYSDKKKADLLNNRKVSGRTQLERELVKVCGSYSKSNLKTEDYIPYVENAIVSAKKLVIRKTDRWPPLLGSHVFKLMEKLMT